MVHRCMFLKNKKNPKKNKVSIKCQECITVRDHLTQETLESVSWGNVVDPAAPWISSGCSKSQKAIPEMCTHALETI